jgi:hypothetical protein
VQSEINPRRQPLVIDFFSIEFRRQNEQSLVRYLAAQPALYGTGALLGESVHRIGSMVTDDSSMFFMTSSGCDMVRPMRSRGFLNEPCL